MSRVKAISNFDYEGKSYTQGEYLEGLSDQQVQFLLGVEAVAVVDEAESDGRDEETSEVQETPVEEQPQAEVQPAETQEAASEAPLEVNSEEAPDASEASVSEEQPAQPTPSQIQEDIESVEGGSDDGSQNIPVSIG